MYALFIICNAFLPMRLDDNIANISKERFSEQHAKISRGGSVHTSQRSTSHSYILTKADKKG